MWRVVLLTSLLCACAHRTPVVQHNTSEATLPLIGTWRGALDASPVTLTVYGSDDRGLHAELALEHAGGQEHWVMLGDDQDDGLTFAAVDGLPTCRAAMLNNRLVGECEVEPGGRKRQWLVVRL